MSNPIADTAEYFVRYRQNAQEIQENDDHASPITAATATATSRGMTIGESIHNDSTMSDVRSQWLRVLNRISFLNPIDNTVDERLLSDDESADMDRDTFELMRSAARENRHRSRHHSLNASTSATGAVRGRDEEPTVLEEEENEQEEKLPSAYDLENDQVYPLSDEPMDEESNYFTHPFQAEDSTIEQDLPIPQQPPPILKTAPATKSNRRLETESSTTHADTTGGEYDDSRIIKDKWDRTLDKLKLIANLQSGTQPPTPPPSHQTHVMLGPSHTLATYYPPAFDPIFAAFAKDEYGRNLVGNTIVQPVV